MQQSLFLRVCVFVGLVFFLGGGQGVCLVLCVFLKRAGEKRFRNLGKYRTPLVLISCVVLNCYYAWYITQPKQE